MGAMGATDGCHVHTSTLVWLRVAGQGWIVPSAHERDLMPRKPRLFVPGGNYHVYCRVARGELVFDEHDEAVEFIETLRTVRDLDGLTIFAWRLMGNHLVLRNREIVL